LSSKKRRKAATPPAILTEADDLDQLRAMVRDAVMCHFDEEDRPRVLRLP
jgi:hypothetical protein